MKQLKTFFLRLIFHSSECVFTQLIQISIKTEGNPHQLSRAPLSSLSGYFFSKLHRNSSDLIRLPSDDLEAWKLILYWNHEQSIPGEILENDHHLALRCWLLGKKLNMRDFQDEVMMVWIKSISGSVCGTLNRRDSGIKMDLSDMDDDSEEGEIKEEETDDEKPLFPKLSPAIHPPLDLELVKRTFIETDIGCPLRKFVVELMISQRFDSMNLVSIWTSDLATMDGIGFLPMYFEAYRRWNEGSLNNSGTEQDWSRRSSWRDYMVGRESYDRHRWLSDI